MRPTPIIRRREAGFTLAELVMVAAVLTILAAATLPVAKFTAKLSKEADLKLALREMRSAIDEYKRYSDAGLIPVDLGTQCTPRSWRSWSRGCSSSARSTRSSSSCAGSPSIR